MLTVNPETICFLIGKAREFQAKEDVVIPETPESPSDDWALQVLADHIEDLTLQEVRATVDDLDPDQQAEIVALMWLGRGDYDLEEWDMAVADSLDFVQSNPTEYLFSHPFVADYLEEAILQHGYSCDE